MLPSSLLQSLLVCIPFIPNVSAQSFEDTITDPTKRAEYALSTLQIWYNAGAGIWDTAGWWNGANIMTMIGNLAKADPNNARLQSLATRLFANTLMQAPSRNPQPGIEKEALRRRDVDLGNGTFTLFNNTGFETGYTKALNPSTNEPLTIYPTTWHKPGPYVDITSLPIYKSEAAAKGGNNQEVMTTSLNPDDWLDGFYDDDLWWALAWINAYDLTSNPTYLTLAEGIFAAVTKVWPTRCFNGGIYWSWERTYMNAIANELFMSTAAHLANRVSADKKPGYVDWAQRTLAWFLRSGMINEKSTINDGLADDCSNNGAAVWSYNQGVILGALVELNTAAPDPSYLPLASRIANAALAGLTDKTGILHDPCEPGCGGDGNQFKGIFMRNLQLLYGVAPEQAFVDAVRVNAESIWGKNRGGDMGVVFGVNWAGPYGGPPNATLQGSAMDALVAGIVVR
ncbi:glycoside hydrolase family 76 protein [Plenodomus tracheiphilus IPT5]|uniref:Glycoside hydrolase family 76 protein n=1 Tax=Plenodomus tracheiphilus IPT5 TaxID=1408161 RepID=A0A6A7ASB4_9PLEO|nr:glycoside hydrolase family 76 protein [Plenodomus tracheiphilus IPT5]